MCLQRNRWTLVTGDLIASSFDRLFSEGVDTNLQASHAHCASTLHNMTQPDTPTAFPWLIRVSQTHTSEDAAWLSGSGAQLVIETFWVRIPVRAVTGTNSYQAVCVTEHILLQRRYDEFNNMRFLSAVLVQKVSARNYDIPWPFASNSEQWVLSQSYCGAI